MSNIVVGFEEPKRLGPQIGYLASEDIQHPGYGLPRILLPRTPLNSVTAGYYATNECYRLIVVLTKETRRTLTLEALVADGRDERIAWAERALDMGAFPSPNLSSLALLSVERTPSPWEVDDLFRRSLKELNLPVVGREEGLRQYARDAAEKIASGVVWPLEGSRQLRNLVCALGYPEDMQPWGDFYEDLFLIYSDEGKLIYSDDMPAEIKREAHTLLHRIPKKYY